MNSVPRFDRVAPIYRPMEFLSFGPMLERCRFSLLPLLSECRTALVIGDGDGRFVARLLSSNPRLTASAVDGSPAMLRLLTARVARIGAQSRLTVTCMDARTFSPLAAYDLVATHFFLDCLSADETEHLIGRIRDALLPNACWLVSEFDVAAGPLGAGLSRCVIAALYLAFRILTGLRVRAIPPWRTLLSTAGFVPVARRAFLGGLLISELWQLSGTTALPALSSQRE